MSSPGPIFCKKFEKSIDKYDFCDIIINVSEVNKMLVVLSGILALVGIYLGMTEEPRIDYSEVWEALKKDLEK